MRGLGRQLGALVVVSGAAVAGLAYAAGSGRLDPGSLREAVNGTLREPRFWLRHAHFVGLEALRAEELWERSGVRPGTPLVDLLYQCFEIITYTKVTMREDDALNRAACGWARENQDRFPIDPRPLKRRRLRVKTRDAR